MDTVEGTKGGKVLLTLFFRKHNLMLIYLLENKTKDDVTTIFNNLKHLLGKKLFRKLFRVILTDNGSEFFNPTEIENFEGKKCINLFYCDPCSSWQKGGIEKNHEYIRYVLPKGSTFDYLIEEDINLIMNHINNTPRGVLKNKSPYNSFKEEYGIETLKNLNNYYIKPNDVYHSKKLLINHNERKKSLMKLINDLEHYYQSKQIKIDNNTKKEIINYFIEDWYLYTDESLFYNALNFIERKLNK